MVATVGRKGFKNHGEYEAWLCALLAMSSEDRPLAYLRRYPHGTTLSGMLPWMGLGQGSKAKRQLDGLLRRLEDDGIARVYRAGEKEEVRLWAMTRREMRILGVEQLS